MRQVPADAGLYKKFKWHAWRRFLQLKGWSMLLLFYFLPSQAYRFMHDDRLPRPHCRIRRENNLLDEFSIVREISSPMGPIAEANIVMPGKSFDPQKVRELKGPTFLVNWPVKVDHPQVYYTTSDSKYLKGFIEKNMLPVFFVQCASRLPDGSWGYGRLEEGVGRIFTGDNKFVNVHLKSNIQAPATGSGLTAIMALAHLAGRLNIYGWDHYLRRSPADFGYLRLLASLNPPEGSHFPVGSIAGSIFGFHYAMRLAEVSHIHNYGYTAGLAKFSKLKKKLEKVFYSDAAGEEPVRQEVLQVSHSESKI